MAELPEARICHVSAGRVRVRITSMKRDADYFSRLTEYLSPLPGVERVEANPLTGSVLVLHSMDLKSVDDLKAVADYSQVTGLFKIVVEERSSGPLAKNLADTFAALNAQLKASTGGKIDMATLAVLGLIGVGIVQISQGAVAVPAITALWYASSILMDQSGKDKQQTPAA